MNVTGSKKAPWNTGRISTATKELELLNKIQLVEMLAERFLNKGARGSNKKRKGSK